MRNVFFAVSLAVLAVLAAAAPSALAADGAAPPAPPQTVTVVSGPTAADQATGYASLAQKAFVREADLEVRLAAAQREIGELKAALNAAIAPKPPAPAPAPAPATSAAPAVPAAPPASQ